MPSPAARSDEKQFALGLELSSDQLIKAVPSRVVDFFERFTLELIERGFTRYSADAILHRIRWHYQVERGDREFKVNNNWAAPLSRWFMGKHPQYRGFFATRGD